MGTGFSRVGQPAIWRTRTTFLWSLVWTDESHCGRVSVEGGDHGLDASLGLWAGLLVEAEQPGADIVILLRIPGLDPIHKPMEGWGALLQPHQELSQGLTVLLSPTHLPECPLGLGPDPPIGVRHPIHGAASRKVSPRVSAISSLFDEPNLFFIFKPGERSPYSSGSSVATGSSRRVKC